MDHGETDRCRYYQIGLTSEYESVLIKEDE